MATAPKDLEKQTPLMKQFWEIKALHEDKILLFRMGDFFEMFFDDAVKAAPLLGIALTQRNKKSTEETPMCGVPHHSIAGPINKLLAHGLKVAICDQIEDPKFAKGIVKRAVTRVLTPGMVYDSATLDQSLAHYIASFDESTLAMIDTTTGESLYFDGLTEKECHQLLTVLPVAEIVLSEEQIQKNIYQARYKDKLLSSHEGFIAENTQLPKTAQKVLSYVRSLANDEILKTLSPFQKKDLKKRLELSSTVIRHLEIFSTYRGEGAGSLYHTINKTKTSSGARLLRQWLSFPLREKAEILNRQDVVTSWMQDLGLLKRVREILSAMGDIERRLGRISLPTCNPRDLSSLAQSIRAGLSALEIKPAMKHNFSSLLDLSNEIERTISEEAPISAKQGYIIKKGVNPTLDEYIALTTESHQLIAQMEAKEKELTGISSLKIRYNNVFGYYIEITNSHKEKTPTRYQRKQTLANAERFCTDELIELEKKVLTAQTKRNDLEFQIYEELRNKVLIHAQGLLLLAQAASELDVMTSLAWLALEEKFVKPTFSETQKISLKSSRHPVVEQSVKKDFVPNDIVLDKGHCLLLTGPNMAGKSTIMRQVALTAIMAQMGSFVPATACEIPLYDAIYTRIGASDMLSEGLSTFMVEMSETSEILKEATAQSLIVLDEIGRGTSTYDGMALAQSILEYLVSSVKAHIFFATHYHELTSLDQVYPQVKNAHMKISDSSYHTTGEIKFLHTLVNGPAKGSYGIQVAEIAGLPEAVTKKASRILNDLTQGTKKLHKPSPQMSLMDFSESVEMPLAQAKADPTSEALITELKDLAVSKMTPLEALNKISQWQQKLN